MFKSFKRILLRNYIFNPMIGFLMSTQAERNCGRESNMGLGSTYRIGFLKRRIESELSRVWSNSDPSTSAKPVPCLCRSAPRSMLPCCGSEARSPMEGKWATQGGRATAITTSAPSLGVSSSVPSPPSSDQLHGWGKRRSGETLLVFVLTYRAV